MRSKNFFKVLHNAQAMECDWANKGDSSECFGKALFSPQVEHFYPKLNQKPCVPFFLESTVRIFFIWHNDRPLK